MRVSIVSKFEGLVGSVPLGSNVSRYSPGVNVISSLSFVDQDIRLRPRDAELSFSLIFD
jgi:hypothetical protein